MTREELWALDQDAVFSLADRYSIARSMQIQAQIDKAIDDMMVYLLWCLYEHSLELQQDSAENEVESHREYWHGEGRVDGLTDR